MFAPWTQCSSVENSNGKTVTRFVVQAHAIHACIDSVRTLGEHIVEISSEASEEQNSKDEANEALSRPVLAPESARPAHPESSEDIGLVSAPETASEVLFQTWRGFATRYHAHWSVDECSCCRGDRDIGAALLWCDGHLRRPPQQLGSRVRSTRREARWPPTAEQKNITIKLDDHWRPDRGHEVEGSNVERTSLRESEQQFVDDILINTFDPDTRTFRAAHAAPEGLAQSSGYSARDAFRSDGGDRRPNPGGVVILQRGRPYGRRLQGELLVGIRLGVRRLQVEHGRSRQRFRRRDLLHRPHSAPDHDAYATALRGSQRRKGDWRPVEPCRHGALAASSGAFSGPRPPAVPPPRPRDGQQKRATLAPAAPATRSSSSGAVGAGRNGSVLLPPFSVWTTQGDPMPQSKRSGRVQMERTWPAGTKPPSAPLPGEKLGVKPKRKARDLPRLDDM